MNRRNLLAGLAGGLALRALDLDLALLLGAIGHQRVDRPRGQDGAQGEAHVRGAQRFDDHGREGEGQILSAIGAGTVGEAAVGGGSRAVAGTAAAARAGGPQRDAAQHRGEAEADGQDAVGITHEFDLMTPDG